MYGYVVGFALLVSAGTAHADCRASANAGRSIAVTLSPRAGVLCLHDVAVHEGGSCEGPPVWQSTFGCSETRRMVVTDDGALVTLLADRASRREWEIVRVFVRHADRLEVRSVRLDELPGLPERARRPRLSLDARGLSVALEPPARVEIAALVRLGRVRARRRLR